MGLLRHTYHRTAIRIHLSILSDLSTTDSLPYGRTSYHNVFSRGLDAIDYQYGLRHTQRPSPNISLITHVILAVVWTRNHLFRPSTSACGDPQHSLTGDLVETSDKRRIPNWNRCRSIWAKILHIPPLTMPMYGIKNDRNSFQKLALALLQCHTRVCHDFYHVYVIPSPTANRRRGATQNGIIHPRRRTTRMQRKTQTNPPTLWPQIIMRSRSPQTCSSTNPPVSTHSSTADSTDCLSASS